MCPQSEENHIDRAHQIIACDGPAASGKGTIARALASVFDYGYLDTGLIYRSIAHLVMQTTAYQSSPPADLADAVPHDIALAIVPHLTAVRIKKCIAESEKNGALRIHAVGKVAAQIAKIIQIRAAVLDIQKKFAYQPPDGSKGVILDGRDIGTIICPDADVKLFITALPEIRAHRRWFELKDQSDISEAQVRADIVRRDAEDLSRPIAPLRLAENALLLDTTDLSIEEACTVAQGMCQASDLVS